LTNLGPEARRYFIASIDPQADTISDDLRNPGAVLGR
jgi:hypothetical protein